jgi:hypothetical protein
MKKEIKGFLTTLMLTAIMYAVSAAGISIAIN